MEDNPKKDLQRTDPEAQNALIGAGPARLAWRATWFDQRAFDAVNHDWRPFQRGLIALLVALAAAAIAQLIGTGLGIMTSPQISVIQDQIFGALTATNYYTNLAAQSADFAAQFSAAYVALWEAIRLVGGYPSYAGMGGALINLLLVLANWLTFATLAFVVGRWLGADVPYDRTLGVFALAYTPIMITVIEAIPGAYVPWSLVFLLILVAKFLAAREVFALGSGGTLAAILLPYLIGLILLVGVLLFAAALGLNQVPFLDEFLRTLRFAR